MFPFQENSRKCKLVYTDGEQISCYLGMEGKGKRNYKKAPGKFSGL